MDRPRKKTRSAPVRDALDENQRESREVVNSTSESDDHRPPTNIASASEICHQKLEQCSMVSTLQHAQWAENRLAEFNFWIASVGALAGKKACLDERLLRAQENEVRFILIEHLTLLITLLDRCMNLGKSQNNSQSFQMAVRYISSIYPRAIAGA